jgi:2,4-dienoyl-CoA reductase-like NADH-dependent reductase (Old Yellow Enzyme family)
MTSADTSSPTASSALFTPITLSGLTLANRVWVSPMCQYSAVDGLAQPWHLAHLGALATGRPGLVLTEATAVTPEGRISPEDLGLWSDEHAAALAPVVDFVHGEGVPIGIQLAHAGRKASTYAPWRGHDSVPLDAGGWTALAPSAAAFGRYAVPQAMSADDLVRTREAWGAATVRAAALGVDAVEIHGAHGYLLHEFLSPLSNHRTDQYGGELAGRMRYPLEIVETVRAAWPDDKPLVLRLSASDWVPGGWDVESTVVLAREAAARGVDLVDVSSGGLDPAQAIEVGPGYQVPFAAAVREGAGVLTGAVGLITEPEQAEAIVADGQADVVLLARALLREPRWPLLAAARLGASVPWPPQYERARPA